jgi:hypothetical protein
MTKETRSYSIASVIKNYRNFLSQKEHINALKVIYNRHLRTFKQAEMSATFPVGK